MVLGLRNRRHVWQAVGAVAVIAVALGGYLLLTGDRTSATPPATVQVKRGDVTSSVVAAGTVAPVANRELAFAVSGTLTDVKVRAGDAVTVGQVLAAVDPADAQATVDAAQQKLDESKLSLTAAESAATATAAPAAACPVMQQAAQVPVVVNVNLAASPTASASPQPSASPTPTTTPTTTPATTPPTTRTSAPPAPGRSGTGTGTCTGGNTGGGSGGNTGSSRTGADAIYSAQISVNAAELALTQAQRKLAGTTIVAPVAGKVLTVGGRAGDPVGTSTFITLGVVEQMMVKADFAEADATTIVVAQPATVQLANRKTETFPMTISQVAAVGTVSAKLVRYTVLLSFDTLPADLMIGQSATTTVVLNKSAKVLFLPQSAVKVTGTGVGEVKLVSGSKQVQIGLRGDGNVEITGGLAEGDTVLLNARS
jgi:multidrug efflux pump subunit AcrA (membrane-fusion protein)